MSIAKLFRTLGRNDVRLIGRDHLLVFMFSYTFVLAAGLRFLLQSIAARGEDGVNVFRFTGGSELQYDLKDGGLLISGSSDGGRLAEYIELPDHPFYIGTQAHPEFHSSLEEPNPLYHGFVKAALR